MSLEPVFVVGVGRSGTTLLRMMLHHHPMVAVPYESHFITAYLGDRDPHEALERGSLEQLVDKILDEPMLQAWDHDFDRERVLQGVGEPSLAGALRAIYEDYAQGKGKAMWGDKSDYLDRMYQINDIFPNARFLHIVRDGRDVAASVMKMPWGPNDIIEAAEWWSEHVRLGRSMGRMLPKSRYLEVSYERLVIESETVLKEVCDFLALPYSASMLDYHTGSQAAIPESRLAQHYNADRPPVCDRVQAWKRSMSPVDAALFEKYASKELSRFGYERSDTRPSSAQVRLAQVWKLGKRFAG